jgi:phosphatidylinositol glycan class P protein
MEGANKAEIYGFIVWVLTIMFYGKRYSAIYILWAFVPDHILKSVGITYYPSKYWAVAIPCYFCMFVLTVQFIYQGLNMLFAKPPTSYCTLEDKHTRKLPADFKETAGIPEISDIPINVVNRVLYG